MPLTVTGGIDDSHYLRWRPLRCALSPDRLSAVTEGNSNPSDADAMEASRLVPVVNDSTWRKREKKAKNNL